MSAKSKPVGDFLFCTQHPLYKRWQGIKSRCYRRSSNSYSDYGGRGIKMHEPWIDDFEAFALWVELNLGLPLKGQSLDRSDNDGDYEPGNLRWASKREQNLNRRCCSATPHVTIGRSGARYQVIVGCVVGNCDSKSGAEFLASKFYAEFGDDVNRMTSWAERNKGLTDENIHGVPPQSSG